MTLASGMRVLKWTHAVSNNKKPTVPTKTPASIVPAFTLLIVACASVAYGAPSQATKDRCTPPIKS